MIDWGRGYEKGQIVTALLGDGDLYNSNQNKVSRILCKRALQFDKQFADLPALFNLCI